MKKMADIMEELGFRPDGSDEVKKAFIKNLIKQAQISERQKQFSGDNVVDNLPLAENTKELIASNEQLSLFDKKIS